MKIFAMAVVISAAFSSIAQAQVCVESVGDSVSILENGNRFEVPVMLRYTARIANRDLQNSAGMRLTGIGAILQQDRANYHKTSTPDISGPFRDSQDGYFFSLSRRVQIGRAPIYNECGLSADQLEDFNSNLRNATLPGVVDVAVFRHPSGGLGLALSQVD